MFLCFLISCRQTNTQGNILSWMYMKSRERLLKIHLIIYKNNTSLTLWEQQPLNRWALSEPFTEKKKICMCQEALKCNFTSHQMKCRFVLLFFSLSAWFLHFLQVLLGSKGTMLVFFALVWTKPLSGALIGRSKGPLRALNFQVKDFTGLQGLYCSRATASHICPFDCHRCL